MYVFLFLIILQTANALVRGESTNEMPGLVRITFQNGWVCSGIFLNQTTILTAAHCLPDDSSVKLITDAHEKEVSVKTLKLIPHPEFKNQLWHSHDIGLIKTTTYADFKLSYLFDDSFAGKSTLYGCGRTNPDKMEYDCALGENSFLRLGNLIFFTGGKACVAPNDSGGPLIVEDKILGIMSKSYVDPCFSSGTAITDENKVFIEREMK